MRTSPRVQRGNRNPWRVFRGTLGATVAIVIAVTSMSLANATEDPAAEKAKVDQEIAAAAEGLAEVSKELRDAYSQLALTRGRLPDAEAELKAANERHDEAKKKDADLATRLKAAKEAERNQAAQIEATEKSINETRSTIGRIGASAYRDGGLTAGLTAALETENFSEMADRYIIANTALRSQNNAVTQLSQQRGALKSQQERLSTVRQEVTQLKQQAADNVEVAKKAAAEAAERKAEVERLIGEQEAATRVIESRKSEEEAAMSALQRQSSALEEEMRRLAEEARRRAEEERRRQDEANKKKNNSGGGSSSPDADRPENSQSTLRKPVNGRITSKYGMRMHPIYKYRRMHTGIDFGGGCGTPIYAAEDGRVSTTRWAGGYGNQLIIDHGVIGGRAFASSYNHLKRFAVRPGQRVSRGQVVAYEGTTGASTGCHLHFEVFVDGRRTNPAKYL